MMEQTVGGETRSMAKGISVSDLSHGFDGTPVLENISLSVQQGEILAVIGPSGTGKTTLLRLLSLFQRPDEGVIRFDGTDCWSLSERERLAVRRQVGMVFQQPNLFDATVRRNVSYGLHIRRGWRERLRQWVDRIGTEETPPVVRETLHIVGMDDAESQHVSSLSGGEQQRVAFARALAYDPDFLLLDEPTSDLDPRNTAVIEGAVETARDSGLGVAVATHDMHQAKRIADRVAVLLDGTLIEVGPTDRVFEHPSDQRTRKFIDGKLIY